MKATAAYLIGTPQVPECRDWKGRWAQIRPGARQQGADGLGTLESSVKSLLNDNVAYPLAPAVRYTEIESREDPATAALGGCDVVLFRNLTTMRHHTLEALGKREASRVTVGPFVRAWHEYDEDITAVVCRSEANVFDVAKGLGSDIGV